MKNGLFALVLMAVIFGSSYYIADTFAAEYMRSHYEAVKKYPQKMMAASEQVLSVFLGDREWQVSNHSPVQSGRTKLKIWTDKKPEAAIYLKGFVGYGFNTQTEQWNVITDNSLQNEYEPSNREEACVPQHACLRNLRKGKEYRGMLESHRLRSLFETDRLGYSRRTEYHAPFCAAGRRHPAPDRA